MESIVQQMECAVTFESNANKTAAPIVEYINRRSRLNDHNSFHNEVLCRFFPRDCYSTGDCLPAFRVLKLRVGKES